MGQIASRTREVRYVQSSPCNNVPGSYVGAECQKLTVELPEHRIFFFFLFASFLPLVAITPKQRKRENPVTVLFFGKMCEKCTQFVSDFIVHL